MDMTLITYVKEAGCEVNSLWRHRGWWTLVDIGSGKGFLPDATKPFPEPMINYNQ